MAESTRSGQVSILDRIAAQATSEAQAPLGRIPPNPEAALSLGAW